MKNKEKFISALSTLLYSWGGDTPPEAIWGVNELLDWYEAEYGVVIGLRFEEEPGEDEEEDRFEQIAEIIRNHE